jgi:hypothetical protein
MPNRVVVFSLRIEFEDLTVRDRFLDWLRDGHSAAVVREGGALSGEVSVLDDGAVEARYLFGSRTDFQAYESGPGAVFDAEGSRMFPVGPGIRLMRSVGERVLRVPD